VSVPAPGEYGLEVFVNDPTKDGKMLRHMCQYLLVCDEPMVSATIIPDTIAIRVRDRSDQSEERDWSDQGGTAAIRAWDCSDQNAGQH